MKGNVLTVERTIPAPPEAIFNLLADATQHPRIDGSGSVKRAKSGAETRLRLGSNFGMAMQAGLKYSMANTVIEYQDNRRIAWQTKAPGPVGLLVGGRIWRYELEPVPGGTRVKESWDLSRDHQRLFLKLGRMPAMTKGNMERTLERIERALQPPERGPSGAPE
jgi:uncharacterized protein YndB with AHSA1/START domain